MKAKIWGSKFYFFLMEPLVKILCFLKRGVKILYFFPVPWKRGVKTAEPTNQLHWRGAPPGNYTHYFTWDVINNPCSNLKSSWIKPALILRHGWVIIPLLYTDVIIYQWSKPSAGLANLFNKRSPKIKFVYNFHWNGLMSKIFVKWSAWAISCVYGGYMCEQTNVT